MNTDDLTPAERAALRFADLFATNHLAIDDAVYDDLRLHFTEGELVAERRRRIRRTITDGRPHTSARSLTRRQPGR